MAHFNCWTPQALTVFQTVREVPVHGPVPGPSYMAPDHTGVVLQGMSPHLYNVLNERPSAIESRKFLLESSIFDLVDAHPYLALTDQKLLGWYLHLSPEDREIIQDEGGFLRFLQRHPALELSNHHVYVKYLEVLPNNVECWSNSGDGSQQHQHEVHHTEQLIYLQDNFPTACNSPITQANKGLPQSHLTEEMDSSDAVCKDRAAVVSFSVDKEWERCRQGGRPELTRCRQGGRPELTRCRQGGRPELKSQIAMTQNQCANFAFSEVSPLHSQWPTSEKESPVDDTVHDDETISSFEDQSDSLHCGMEDNKSILRCLASKDVKARDNRVHLGPVTTNSDTLAASSKTLKSNQSVIKTAEKYTSCMPCVTTCDIMVGTELAPCVSVFTQTEDAGTSDKHVITQVHMADLDYLAEELKMAKEELREKKEKTKSLDCKLRKECGCIQRAQRAELCLLALQYSMCRQHCWSLYYTSAEGGQLTTLPKSPPENIINVLQKLESDYNQMRDKILAGVTLEQLKPLSVDSEKITMGASYIPAQIIGDLLRNIPSWSSQEPYNTSVEENRSPDNQSRNGCQVCLQTEMSKKSTTETKSLSSLHGQRKGQNSKARRAVTFVHQDRDSIHDAKKEEEKQTTACGEVNTSEAWYDAEEVLEPAGSAGAAETGQDPKDKTNESASEEAKSSLLCVSNLPSNVTERDVMLWFEKYNASEVSISPIKNDLRVAIVMISGPQSAKAAVRELNGCCMQGHTLHVEHINRANGGSHSQASASISWPESSQDVTKPQASKTQSSSTERRLTTQPPLGSSIKIRKVVSIFPTAKGTCVPQHFGTMGSFDTLMAELTQRHPDVERQRIMDALMELKAKHQGILGSLPLRTIREMASELLTRPPSAP